MEQTSNCYDDSHHHSDQHCTSDSPETNQADDEIVSSKNQSSINQSSINQASTNQASTNQASTNQASTNQIYQYNNGNSSECSWIELLMIVDALNKRVDFVNEKLLILQQTVYRNNIDDSLLGTKSTNTLLVSQTEQQPHDSIHYPYQITREELCSFQNGISKWVMVQIESVFKELVKVRESFRLLGNEFHLILQRLDMFEGRLCCLEQLREETETNQHTIGDSAIRYLRNEMHHLTAEAFEKLRSEVSSHLRDIRAEMTRSIPGHVNQYGSLRNRLESMDNLRFNGFIHSGLEPQSLQYNEAQRGSMSTSTTGTHQPVHHPSSFYVSQLSSKMARPSSTFNHNIRIPSELDLDHDRQFLIDNPPLIGNQLGDSQLNFNSIRPPFLFSYNSYLQNPSISTMSTSPDLPLYPTSSSSHLPYYSLPSSQNSSHQSFSTLTPPYPPPHHPTLSSHLNSSSSLNTPPVSLPPPSLLRQTPPSSLDDMNVFIGSDPWTLDSSDRLTNSHAINSSITVPHATTAVESDQANAISQDSHSMSNIISIFSRTPFEPKASSESKSSTPIDSWAQVAACSKSTTIQSSPTIGKSLIAPSIVPNPIRNSSCPNATTGVRHTTSASADRTTHVSTSSMINPDPPIQDEEGFTTVKSRRKKRAFAEPQDSSASSSSMVRSCSTNSAGGQTIEPASNEKSRKIHALLCGRSGSKYEICLKALSMLKLGCRKDLGCFVDQVGVALIEHPERARILAQLCCRPKEFVDKSTFDAEFFRPVLNLWQMLYEQTVANWQPGSELRLQGIMAFMIRLTERSIFSERLRIRMLKLMEHDPNEGRLRSLLELLNLGKNTLSQMVTDEAWTSIIETAVTICENEQLFHKGRGATIAQAIKTQLESIRRKK